MPFTDLTTCKETPDFKKLILQFYFEFVKIGEDHPSYWAALYTNQNEITEALVWYPVVQGIRRRNNPWYGNFGPFAIRYLDIPDVFSHISKKIFLLNNDYFLSSIYVKTCPHRDLKNAFADIENYTPVNLYLLENTMRKLLVNTKIRLMNLRDNDTWALRYNIMTPYYYEFIAHPSWIELIERDKKSEHFEKFSSNNVLNFKIFIEDMKKKAVW
jgi:hypothetical protein